MLGVFDGLQAEIADLEVTRPVGRVVEIGRGTFMVTGLPTAALGDRILADTGAGPLGGEIIRLTSAGATVLPEDDPEGLTIGARACLLGPVTIAPDSSWLGRIVDPTGQPLDGRPLMRGLQRRALVSSPPPAAIRRPLGERMATGVAVFDTLLPMVRGQRIGLFAGSGVGKSSLLARFARGLAADVVVIGLVGERGRELREFTERVLGRQGMRRSVVVTATSDQSPLMRRRCALAAMAVAEAFRDQGMHVLLLLDSVTRFAEAHREVALAAGETASLRGYPPSTAHAIMGLAERAGPGAAGAGDISAVLSVLVAGSDMEEPVADIIRGTLDGHVVLDRKIAERGRYPAIDLLRSVSRSLPHAASAEENVLISEARRSLGAYDRAEMMVQAGLYVQGSDPAVDRAIRLWPALDGFLAEDAPPGGPQASFARLQACLRA
ncbi:FliI/YscN family ATPase [Xinfangfangia sp. CPCC 101601]|uniref:FliI/YscN family ATPase n=1 Tax=Pseudogemmobacter lacusdianii TaxID=3069608 RepID=A0ABU0VUH0_9RHOB|nr:FliI/YscN family ATPase [Xinfangfangia sp. CPCC 101601]MDQ2065303.1 FliI/YscN family ATPase [Xinfangfangia sp. CPCC 101601]